MQGQTRNTDQFLASGDVPGYRPIIQGRRAGVVSAPDDTTSVAADKRNVILTDVRSLIQSADMVASEVWVPGQEVFLYEADGLARVTAEATDVPFGVADADKAADQDNVMVAVKHSLRDGREFAITIDFAAMDELGIDGTYVLRDFLPEGGARWAYEGGLFLQHDGNLAPGTATISIGDGSGANDQVLAATTLAAIQALGQPHTPIAQAIASAPAPVQLGQVAITIALGPVTAGRLTIRLGLSDA